LLEQTEREREREKGRDGEWVAQEKKREEKRG